MASYNYAKEDWVLEQLSSIPKFDIKVVSELPTTDISTTTIYITPNSLGDDTNASTEWIYQDPPGQWEKLGDIAFDVNDYWKKTDFEDNQIAIGNGYVRLGFGTGITMDTANPIGIELDTGLDVTTTTYDQDSMVLKSHKLSEKIDPPTYNDLSSYETDSIIEFAFNTVNHYGQLSYNVIVNPETGEESISTRISIISDKLKAGETGTIIISTGEKVPPIAYVGGYVSWVGDDCDSDGDFIPQPNTTYELCAMKINSVLSIRVGTIIIPLEES